MENATTEYILKKTSRYLLSPACPIPPSTLDLAPCRSVGAGRRSQLRDAAPSVGVAADWRAAPVTCWLYTGQDALYTINTDTVPYPVHYTPAAVMLSQPSTLLHIHIHSHCTALAAVRSSRKTLGNYLLQFLTLHML